VYSKYEDLSALFRRLKIDCVVSEAGGEPREKAASEDGSATAATTDGKTSIH